MSITAAQVKVFATEFEDEDDSRINTFISYAENYINSSVFGTKADFARLLYTAHLLTISARGSSGASGPLTSEKVGDLQRSYASPGSVTDSLESTSYGLEFLRLRKTLLISPIVVR